MMDKYTNFISSCKKITINSLGNFSGDWYLLDTCPLPDYDEIIKVIYDIEHNNSISFDLDTKQLVHNSKCKETQHSLSKYLLKVANALSSKHFTIAVFDNKDPYILQGQPIAIAIEPRITHLNFPDNPHLNAPRSILPSSICYTDSPNSLGEQFEGNRLFDTFFILTEWLFRHQIWEKHRELFGKGLWIGPSAPPDSTPGDFLNFIPPFGRCRCGKNKKYSDCCMKKDMYAKEFFLNLGPVSNYKKIEYTRIEDITSWVNFSKNIKRIEDNFLEIIKQYI